MITYNAPVRNTQTGVIETVEKKAHKVVYNGKNGEVINFGLQKTEGGWECVHLVTGYRLPVLDATAIRHRITLKEAKCGLVDMLDVYDNLVAKIQEAVTGVDQLNPQFA